MKSKLLGLFRERSDLLLAIPGFIVFGPFVNVRLTVLLQTPEPKEAKHEPLLLPIGVQAAITRCHT